NDEEFRNVAVVDRVNTTWAVWMGTSMACAQCHTHKYDPISQREFFQFLAILNNTEDADRRDEAPLLEFYTPDQQRRRARLEAQIHALETTLRTPTPELLASWQRWDEQWPRTVAWHPSRPTTVASQAGANAHIRDDQSVVVAARHKSDVYTVTLPVPIQKLTAVQFEALPDESLPGKGPGHADLGRFVLSRVVASLTPPDSMRPEGRFVRIELPGKQKILSLAEVQVFRSQANVAPAGTATQSSVDFEGTAARAIDGITKGEYDARSVTHTASSDDPWWEVDLGSVGPIDRIVVWNRTDPMTENRLAHAVVKLLDAARRTVWESKLAEAPRPQAELITNGEQPLDFAAAVAETTEAGFDPMSLIRPPADKGSPAREKNPGWSAGPGASLPHILTLLLDKPADTPPGTRLTVTIEQLSKQEFHTVGRFRLACTDDERMAEWSRIPPEIRSVVRKASADRTAEEQATAQQYYLVQRAPELQATRTELETARKQLAEIKPGTVPVLRELPRDKQRVTRIQYRGNFLDLGDEVPPGIPAAFQLPGLPESSAGLDRLAMARWLVDPDNPLTPRVLANRFWEQIFGSGLVRTSEEFGSQGELPTHPELLDWLATELVESGWNMKQFLKLLVTSATYRQSSRVTPALLERDPDNRLLTRGPRFRLSAEMVRDQALFVSGLLSRKMYGPSVKPPQPALGLNAAFGSAIDWKTSEGEDRYRRGLYTEWRRSNPYPSMITFDAPNREVCTLRRNRTNTPLQALVTLNDPVYIECAQGLARRMYRAGTSPRDRARAGFRICLARPPYEGELDQLVQLWEEASAELSQDSDRARQLATQPLGESAEAAIASELAAWTVVANVLLNLDESLMKR
ncbi:MAG: DUF1553 domain-containing protein, partial [Pirellulaceae bacterium]